MKLDADDFTLLGLPRAFTLDRAVLDRQWKAMQAQVHPDRFAAEGGAAQRRAMQWAVRVNEAYQRLKDPLRRASYMCELGGVPDQSESNTAMPADFLMQQMQWRETLEDARDAHEVERLEQEVVQHRHARLAEVARLIDGQAAQGEGEDEASPSYASAAREVRALMFIDRLGEEITRRLEQYEDGL